MTTTTLRPLSITELAARAPAWLTAAGSAVLAAILGWLIRSHSTLAVLAVLPFASLPLLLSARVRVLVFVFGTITVFQSSDELTAPKLLFFGAIAVSLAAVLARLPRLMRTRAFHDLSPLILGSVVLVGLVLVSFVVSYANDVLQRPWLRDVSPYLLVAAAPFFALDAQSCFTQRRLRQLLAAAGSLGALGFAVTWLTNRGIANLDFVPIGLPTMLLPAALFAFAMSAFLEGKRRRLAWVALGSTILAMLVVTGTRTSLVLLAAPLAITFASGHQLTRRSLRLVAAVPVVAVIAFVAAEGVVDVTGGNREVLESRLTQFTTTGEGTADRSYLDRVTQTQAAWALFRSSPLVGVGPGVPIDWVDSLGRPRSSPSVDSPVSFLTKFGLLGLVAVGFLVAGYVGVVRRVRARTGRRTVVQFALVGYAVVIVGLTFLLNSFEDKGLGVGLVLLLALAAREASDHALAQEIPGRSP